MRLLLKSALLILLLLLTNLEAFPQEKQPKSHKRQQDEALASRLFIDGQRFLMLEDYDRAYFYFQKAREKSPDEAAINFKIAEILLRANRVDQALEFGMKAVEIDPDNKYYNLVMAEVYSKQNQPMKAAEILENLMANSDQNQNYILDLASLYLAAGEFDKALGALDRAEEYYGTVAPLTLQKQRIYLRRNNLSAAIAEGQKLVDAYPGNSEYVLNLVEILFNNGRTDEAIALVENSLASYPNQPELQMAAYALYKEKGDIDRAEELIKVAFASPDLDPSVKAQAFADILQETRSVRRDSLLENLEASMMEHHPNDAGVLTVVGDKRLFEGKKEEALELYQKSVRLNPSNPQVMQGVITTMFELGKDFSEIESFTSMAVDEFPDKAEFWFFDGTAKLAQKKGPEAVTSLEKALEVNANKNQQITLLVNGQIGDAYHLVGRKEDAFKAYDAVLKVNPSDEHVLNNYAYYLSLAKEDLEKAKSMSEGLVKRFPKNATYLDTHAWVLFQLKDYANAKLYMEQALENEANPSGVMWEHYGDILYHLGQKNEAVTYWKKAEGGEDVSEQLSQKSRKENIMIKNALFFILVLFLIVGCAKQPNLYTSDEIMEEFEPASFEFKYLQAKGRIVLEEPSGKITKGTITLRAKKDSALWFSITPGLGLEAIRGLVTADKVQIRDRMNGEDVNMSFSEIKDRHGLNFSLPLIQNMVYANIPEEFSYRDRLIRVGKYFELTQVREGFRYHSRISTNIAKVTELSTTSLDDRGNLEFSYPVFEEVDGQPFPNKMLMKLSIKNRDGEQNTIIHIDLSKIETSSIPISFPFQY